ncbi:MAG: helix-turn-helix domain-containing protein [Phycisphaerales bacterium]|nr:helix-turn-helix domain-containing protein [Phycisphaerales bacterium]
MTTGRSTAIENRDDVSPVARVHSPALLRAADVAALLAISVRCVWRLVASGDLPRPIKLGGSTRWRACDLEAFIAEAGAEQRTGVGARR